MERRRQAESHATPRAVGRVAGRVRLGPVSGRVPPIEQARTKVTHLDDRPKPVFADTSGIRHRRLRRVSYAVGALLLILLIAFWISQLTGALR